jgi:hypothetical protein
MTVDDERPLEMRREFLKKRQVSQKRQVSHKKASLPFSLGPLESQPTSREPKRFSYTHGIASANVKLAIDSHVLVVQVQQAKLVRNIDGPEFCRPASSQKKCVSDVKRKRRRQKKVALVITVAIGMGA